MHQKQLNSFQQSRNNGRGKWVFEPKKFGFRPTADKDLFEYVNSKFDTGEIMSKVCCSYSSEGLWSIDLRTCDIPIKNWGMFSPDFVEALSSGMYYEQVFYYGRIPNRNFVIALLKFTGVFEMIDITIE